ncbi:MAG: hypothetical protein V3S89_00520, partial [Desulfobacterales bacterium]
MSAVHIIGPNELQNKLLQAFLEKETGLTCTSGSKMDVKADDFDPEVHSLILYDCLGSDPAELWAVLETGSNNGLSACSIALLNTLPETGDEKDFIDQGIRGVFHNGEPLKLLAKGVQAILDGEMWYSRKTLSETITDPDRSRKTPSAAASTITAREREILIEI